MKARSDYKDDMINTFVLFTVAKIVACLEWQNYIEIEYKVRSDYIDNLVNIFVPFDCS